MKRREINIPPETFLARLPRDLIVPLAEIAYNASIILSPTAYIPQHQEFNCSITVHTGFDSSKSIIRLSIDQIKELIAKWPGNYTITPKDANYKLIIVATNRQIYLTIPSNQVITLSGPSSQLLIDKFSLFFADIRKRIVNLESLVGIQY